MRSVLQALEELHSYLKGQRDSISLESLILMIKYGYLYADYTKPISINVRLSTGTVISSIVLPLDLNSEQGIKDAFRLVRYMTMEEKNLTPTERKLLYMLRRRLNTISYGTVSPKIKIQGRTELTTLAIPSYNR
ncbi:MAG: hypothetical protein J7J99_00925 [Thermoprotei archaeon]|nr:hypothetical protein [Thermoprotei archaeon]